MAKSKGRQPTNKPHTPNPHLYSRINFLYQSAQLLSQPPNANTPLSRFYLSSARIVAKKSVLRLSPALKRSICKRCDALLIPGATSTHRVVNDSRGGRKPWADVLTIECNGCGAVKRFPMGMEIKKKDWKLWSERPDVLIGVEDATESQKTNAGSQEQKQGTAMEIGGMESPTPVPHKAKKLEKQALEDTADKTADIARINT